MEMPKWNELFLQALQAYADGEPHNNTHIKMLVADSLGLPDNLRNETLLQTKKNKIENRIGWARSALKIAGLLRQTERGTNIITDEGKKLLRNPPKVFDEKFLIDNYPSYKENRERNISNYKKSKNIAQEDLSSHTPDDLIENAISSLDKNLSDELIEKLRQIEPPYRLEYIVSDLLEAMGYGDLKVTQKSKDGGIDAIVNEDKLGLDKILVQVKRYGENNPVNEQPMREFIGTLGANKVAKGIFVTTSYFSPKAAETAKDSDKKIVMIDGEKLTKLMIEYNIGTSIQKTYHIKSLDTDYFDN